MGRCVHGGFGAVWGVAVAGRDACERWTRHPMLRTCVHRSQAKKGKVSLVRNPGLRLRFRLATTALARLARLRVAATTTACGLQRCCWRASRWLCRLCSPSGVVCSPSAASGAPARAPGFRGGRGAAAVLVQVCYDVWVHVDVRGFTPHGTQVFIPGVTTQPTRADIRNHGWHKANRPSRHGRTISSSAQRWSVVACSPAEAGR